MSPSQWLEAFQLALIQENLTKIDTLLLDIPKGNKEELVEMKNLIDATITTFEKEKNQTQEVMKKIKKQRAFLTQEEKKPSLLTLA